MQQWITKFKHTTQEGKKIKKVQVTALHHAISYAEVEKLVAEFVEQEGFVNPSQPDIAKHPTHEILGWDPESADIKQWWKVRVKCTSETDQGKIEVFWSKYLAYADDMPRALKLVQEKEKSVAIPGEIEAINLTKIDYMLIPANEIVHS